MSTEAWTAVAIGEEAAIYGYGVLTAQLSGEDRQAGLDAIDSHRSSRDTARAILAAQDESPAVPVVFDLPFAIKDSKSAAKLAVAMELRLADQYLELVSQSSGAERQTASETAQACTVRATRWGWVPTAFSTLAATKGVVPGSETESPTAGVPGSPPTGSQSPTASAVRPNGGASLQ